MGCGIDEGRGRDSVYVFDCGEVEVLIGRVRGGGAFGGGGREAAFICAGNVDGMVGGPFMYAGSSMCIPKDRASLFFAFTGRGLRVCSCGSLCWLSLCVCYLQIPYAIYAALHAFGYFAQRIFGKFSQRACPARLNIYTEEFRLSNRSVL